jgi:rSAM/selenodomain-associated transferase 1
VKDAAALILMGKAPLPGTVKTRLSPPLTAGDAARFYACMLADTAEEISRLRGIRRYLFFDPPGSERSYRDPAFDGFSLIPQPKRDLGGRMEEAILLARSFGADRVTVVGGDCPALSAERVRLAFRELTLGADAVFGPAQDGGFYLAGFSARAPVLFRGISWSTPTVLEEILMRCRSFGVPYSLLTSERDVDDARDLDALRRWLRGHGVPACPRTRKWIESRSPSFNGLSGRAATRRRAGRASGPSRDR